MCCPTCTAMKVTGLWRARCDPPWCPMQALIYAGEVLDDDQCTMADYHVPPVGCDADARTVQGNMCSMQGMGSFPNSHTHHGGLPRAAVGVVL